MENRKATVPVLLLIVSWVVWIAVTRFRAWGKRKALIAQHACRAPTSPPYSDPFGLRELRESTKAYQSKTLIERGCAKHELYGTTYTSRFLTQKVIHTIEPENIKAVLSTNFDDYGVGWRRKHAFRPLLGDSLFQVDGHAWTKSRAVLQPVFNWVRVSDVDAWEEIVEHFLENVMEAAAGKQTVDLAPYCFTLATNLATSFVRGKSTIKASQAEKQEEQEFLDAMKHAGGGCEKRWQLGVFTFLFPMKEFRGHIRTIQRYIEKQVDEILAVRDTAKMDARRDGLASLTEQTTDKRVLRDEAAMLFVAAADTTGCLLTNLFFLLGRHPVMWTKLREEAKAFGDEKPTAQELKKLKYHKNCIQEALRLFPVLPSNSREAFRDTILPTGGGIDGTAPVLVPAGSLVSVSIMALQRRKDIWGDDAEEFRPDRWNDVQAGINWAYIPFWQGPRICLGNELAISEITYTLFKMARRFEQLDRVDKKPWVESISVGTTSADGAKVVLAPDEGYVVV